MASDLDRVRRELADLRARQERVERRTRLALAGAATLVVASLALGFGRPAPSVAGQERVGPTQRVRAPFEVVDARGRAILRVEAGGGRRSVTVLDGHGQPITVMTDTPEGRGLDVRDAKGQLILGMGTLASPKGEARGLDVFDAAGSDRISLNVGPGALAEGLVLLNATHQRIGQLVTGPEDGGRLQLENAGGKITFRAP